MPENFRQRNQDKQYFVLVGNERTEKIKGQFAILKDLETLPLANLKELLAEQPIEKE